QAREVLDFGRRQRLGVAFFVDGVIDDHRDRQALDRAGGVLDVADAAVDFVVVGGVALQGLRGGGRARRGLGGGVLPLGLVGGGRRLDLDGRLDRPGRLVGQRPGNAAGERVLALL